AGAPGRPGRAGADDRRHRLRAARRDARGHRRAGRAPDARPGRGHARRVPPRLPARPALAWDERDPRQLADRELPRQPKGLGPVLRRDRAGARPRRRAADRPAHGASVSTTVIARRFVSLVKFEHTVFALPFAYVGAILSVGEVPDAATLGWVTLAMVGARSLA